MPEGTGNSTYNDHAAQLTGGRGVMACSTSDLERCEREYLCKSIKFYAFRRFCSWSRGPRACGLRWRDQISNPFGQDTQIFPTGVFDRLCPAGGGYPVPLPRILRRFETDRLRPSNVDSGHVQSQQRRRERRQRGSRCSERAVPNLVAQLRRNARRRRLHGLASSRQGEGNVRR